MKAGGMSAKSVADRSASRSGPTAQEGDLGSRIKLKRLIGASQEQSQSSDRSLAGRSQMEGNSFPGNVCHVTTPTPPIHSTARISHRRNSPRAIRNAIWEPSINSRRVPTRAAGEQIADKSSSRFGMAIRNELGQMTLVIENIGAGEGNRTLVISLEGCCSTIELHPHSGTEISNR
jgi:hypothetical protein